MVIPAPWSLPRPMRYQILQALKTDAILQATLRDLAAASVNTAVIVPKRAPPIRPVINGNGRLDSGESGGAL